MRECLQEGNYGLVAPRMYGMETSSMSFGQIGSFRLHNRIKFPSITKDSQKLGHPLLSHVQFLGYLDLGQSPSMKFGHSLTSVS